MNFAYHYLLKVNTSNTQFLKVKQIDEHDLQHRHRILKSNQE
ncbi:MAG: hypothetical protein QNJ53_25355 [Pleurocapsa sp. MO_192.B19]|nr:hypothetical protein [Pleurocapsa sp. MO_192.B19]